MERNERSRVVQWLECIGALVPAALLMVVMYVVAFFTAVGIGIAFIQHVRRGDPDWWSDLVLIGFLLGTATGGVIGVMGLAIAVFADAATLAQSPARWWLTVVALLIGLTTAVGLLATGYWPRTDVLMAYPLVAASIVAAYRLPLLILARVRPVT